MNPSFLTISLTRSLHVISSCYPENKNILANAEPGYIMGLVPLCRCCQVGDRPWKGDPRVLSLFPQGPTLAMERPRRLTALPGHGCWPRCGSPPGPVWVAAWPWLWQPVEAPVVPHGSRLHEVLSAALEALSSLPPPCRTCLCHLPAGAGASNTIAKIPAPLVASLRGCLARPCHPVPLHGVWLPSSSAL